MREEKIDNFSQFNAEISLLNRRATNPSGIVLNMRDIISQASRPLSGFEKENTNLHVGNLQDPCPYPNTKLTGSKLSTTENLLVKSNFTQLFQSSSNNPSVGSSQVFTGVKRLPTQDFEAIKGGTGKRRNPSSTATAKPASSKNLKQLTLDFTSKK
jgi:hypothetical protein